MTDNKMIETNTSNVMENSEEEVVVNLPNNLDEIIRKSTNIDYSPSPTSPSPTFSTKEKYEDSDGEKQAEVDVDVDISSEENIEFDTSTVVLDPAQFIDPETETVIEYKIESDSSIVQNECVNITENAEEDEKIAEPADVVKDVDELPQLSPKMRSLTPPPPNPIVKSDKSINDRLKPLIDEKIYDGPRLEKLSNRMKILPQVFDVAKKIASVKRKHPEVYTMKQFDIYNFTYHDELRHRFELNKQKGFNANHNNHLKQEAKRYETEDAKMISFVREIYKTCKILCTQYENIDFC